MKLIDTTCWIVLLVLCVVLPAYAAGCPKADHEELSRDDFHDEVVISVDVSQNQATIKLLHSNRWNFAGTAKVNGQTHQVVSDGHGGATVTVPAQTGANSLTLTLTDQPPIIGTLCTSQLRGHSGIPTRK